jgi:hypothetical protein
MSLDTVLQIGKVLRKSGDSSKYFKYVEKCPKDKTDKWPICLTIPVNSSFDFEWNKVYLTPENKKDKLYYLKFKTSDSDSYVRYIFGDIYYERDKEKEGGFYRLKKTNGKGSSFDQGTNDYNSMMKDKGGTNIVLGKFREKQQKSLVSLERMLEYAPIVVEFLDKPEREREEFSNKLNNEVLLKSLWEKRKDKKFSVFIHFAFPQKEHWYSFSEDINLIRDKIVSEFIEADSKSQGRTLKKALYKTLCSGNERSDIQFPLFTLENRGKSRRFVDDEHLDLFYGVKYATQGRYVSPDIKLIVLPKGEYLQEKDYIEFQLKWNEKAIKSKNEADEQTFEHSLFDFCLDDFCPSSGNITAFDLIFCKQGGRSSPDVDMIEISSIGRSELRWVNDIIREVADNISIENGGRRPKLERAFQNIWGDFKQKKGRFSYTPNRRSQSHLLKVLPRIYSKSYLHDKTLLPALIQNVEYNVRMGDVRYHLLKNDLKFLLTLQDKFMKGTEIGRFEKIIESESYQIGCKIGEIASSLRRKINSFEKRYVGLLLRHVNTRDDCVKFIDEIIEMLTRHRKGEIWWCSSVTEVCSQLANLSPAEYNQEYLAFGFFEGYFTYKEMDSRQSLVNRLEKIVSNYEENEDLKEDIDKLKDILDTIKQ